MTRLLGVDLGRSRIGVAIADTATELVRPLATIRRSSDERDSRTIRRLIEEQGAHELVIGLPLDMDGSEGPQATETRGWAAVMAASLGIPVHLRDERLSSERASVRVARPRRGRSGAAPSPAARNAHRSALDREAAALILQAELDARAHAAPRSRAR